MVNNPLRRPYFLQGVARGGTLRLSSLHVCCLFFGKNGVGLQVSPAKMGQGLVSASV